MNHRYGYANSLPELPKPDWETSPFYTADQMLAFREEGIRAALASPNTAGWQPPKNLEFRRLYRNAISDEMAGLSTNHDMWSGWPGTILFAEAALRAIEKLHAAPQPPKEAI